MFFKNKQNKIKCESCSSKVSQNYSFCPYCGNSMLTKDEEIREFGMLGRNDLNEDLVNPAFLQGGLGITDKLIGSLVNTLVKSLDKQFREMEKPEIKSFPTGIRIQISNQQPKATHKKEPVQIRESSQISDEQLKRMSSLPRAIARASIKRFSDKIVYELITPGVESPEDVFVSRLESGYEIKAIGEKKVYTKSLPINLPLRRFILDKNKLLVEFKTDHE